MKIKTVSSKEISVTMKVSVTEDLKRWLMFHSSISTIVKPAYFKKDIIARAKALIKKYED